MESTESSKPDATENSDSAEDRVNAKLEAIQAQAEAQVSEVDLDAEELMQVANQAAEEGQAEKNPTEEDPASLLDAAEVPAPEPKPQDPAPTAPKRSSVVVPAGGTEKKSSPRDMDAEVTRLASGAVEAGSARGEVSGATIARMMGLATANELSMLEGKIDLLSSRVNNIIAKFERLQTTLNHFPTNTDLDRIDINVGSLKTLIRETLDQLTSVQAEKERAKGDEGTLQKATIMSSTEDEE
jgi:hypothetical protein